MPQFAVNPENYPGSSLLPFPCDVITGDDDYLDGGTFWIDTETGLSRQFVRGADGNILIDHELGAAVWIEVRNKPPLRIVPYQDREREVAPNHVVHGC